MNLLLERLLNETVILTDGAWGTELQARGLAAGQFPETWNLSHPELVTDVARSYVDAGSQIILTNTFGANRVRLEETSLAGDVAQINRLGVQISQQAATGRALVFASMGPSGKLLLAQEIKPEELRAAFEEQAAALADARPDAIVIETMADLCEAKAAVAAAKSTGLPVVACMVFDSGKNKDRTMMGVTPGNAARALTDSGADIIGANCGNGIANFLSIAQQLREGTHLPLWLKPNAGLPEWADGQPVYKADPKDFAERAFELGRTGAKFIGGCCGTSPAFIRAIRQRLPGAPEQR